METGGQDRGVRRIGERLRRHARAHVVGYLALFVALGGTGAWAADKITSKDIAKNAVRAKHIKKEAVKTPKIADRAVTAAKLSDDVLPKATLWAKVSNSPSGPTLVQGSGVTSVSDAGTGQVRVRFNQEVDECSYQATGLLEEEGPSSYAHPPILTVERDVVGQPATDVDVQTYSENTGALDSDNYEFTVAVFC